MARTGNSTSTPEGEGLESATPKDATVGSDFEGPKDGIHLTKPRTTVVDDYPERPYSEAITEPHRALLTEFGQEPA